MPIDRTYLLIDEPELVAERRQAIDEGRDFDRIADEFEAVAERVRDDPRAGQDAAADLLDRTVDLQTREGYAYCEPSDLDGIRRERPDGPRRVPVDLDADDLDDRVLGAWLGRCAGCLLGKPVEGWSSDEIEGFLRDLDRYPLDGYLRADVPEMVYERYDAGRRDAFVDRVDHMPRDDDIDYTIAGLAIVDDHGFGFDSADVAGFWLSSLPAYHTFTAERIAYRNLLNLVEPPASARRRNPYREGIGAQIRGDAFGYLSLGDPERAAELAWRDARVSHVKNGIYGEMWVAATLAGAPAADDRLGAIRTGLSEVPARSRFAEAVEAVIGWHEDGVGYDDAVSRLHDRWDESRRYDWLHAVANAQVVTVGLLWGGDGYGRSICRAVQAGFDTDCNGATVGSIVGAMRGTEAIPDEWTDPLNDTVDTALVGYPRQRLSALAERTVELYREGTRA